MDKSKIMPAVLYTLIVAAVLALDIQIFRSGREGLGFIVLVLLALFCFVYAWKGAYVYRYLFPSLFAFSVFVLLPLAYTLYISFTNYSGANLQTLGDVQSLIRRETDTDMTRTLPFKMAPRENAQPPVYDLWLTAAPDPKEANAADQTFLAEGFDPAQNQEDAGQEIEAAPARTAPPGNALKVVDIIKLRDPLKKLLVTLPDGTHLRMVSFTAFAPQKPIWTFRENDEAFVHNQSGEVIAPDFKTGFYKNTQTGANYGPGFRVRIGWDNYRRIFTDPAIRGPFITVFIWTVLFALFSVALTFVLGFLLAVLLEWKDLRGRNWIRTLIILPYSVPAFISILIFKGLFNPQFGEINMILQALFGLSPEWTTDPVLAKTMILIVNLWLGYPYMMILCTGILQSIPSDIYEASSMDGGSPFSDLYKITLPMILPPLKPLLIASFAFNFNNFLLIQLLTNGAPPILGAATSVGHTDILVTYTFNLAFRGGTGGGNYFGFAAAIAAIIFIIVSVLSYLNFRAATRGDTGRS